MKLRSVSRFALQSLLLLLPLGVTVLLTVFRKSDSVNAAVAQERTAVGSSQQQLLYHNNIAIAIMEQFNFREALGELAECSKIDSKFVPGLVNSGLAHFYLQEFPQAEGFFNKAVVLNPSQPN